MPKYLFRFTRPRIITDILEIPVQAWWETEAERKLKELMASDDYDESLYIVEWEIESWAEAQDIFQQDWDPIIIDND